MRVDFEFSPAFTLGREPHTFDVPRSLSVWLRWDDTVAENTIYATIGHNVEAELTPEQPALLLGITGIVRDIAAWQFVPTLIGVELWREALTVLDGELVDHHVQVDVDVFDNARPFWPQLQEIARSARTTSLRPTRMYGCSVGRLTRCLVRSGGRIVRVDDTDGDMVGWSSRWVYVTC